LPGCGFKNVRKLDCAGKSAAFLLTDAAPAADTQPSDDAMVDICRELRPLNGAPAWTSAYSEQLLC
jgi:hypothetical protein